MARNDPSPPFWGRPSFWMVAIVLALVTVALAPFCISSVTPMEPTPTLGITVVAVPTTPVTPTVAPTEVPEAILTRGPMATPTAGTTPDATPEVTAEPTATKRTTPVQNG